MIWEPPAGAPNNFANGERSQKQFLKKVANKMNGMLGISHVKVGRKDGHQQRFSYALQGCDWCQSNLDYEHFQSKNSALFIYVTLLFSSGIGI